MSGEVQIRRAATVADYLACQDAQRRAWGITDESYVVPLATLVGANLHGGLVLGAFTETGEALGLSFAFLGKVDGRLCLYSQLTGVVPGQQGNGLGGRLKHAQRDFARGEGIPCLAWSFDPLQAGNARFNLDRLGATASRYIEDMYGRRTDALNAGVATDRLIVEWATESDRPRPVIADTSGLPRLIDVREREDGMLGPVGHLEITLDEPIALLEIPADVVSIRRNDPALAEAWGLAVRRAFTEGFAAGYRAEGFVRDKSTGRLRCYYVLIRITESFCTAEGG
jgi:predicted GNAT superfamily acetyltransferase